MLHGVVARLPPRCTHASLQHATAKGLRLPEFQTMQNTLLTTRRLRLRSWKIEDAGAYGQHCNTEAVMRYLGGVMAMRDVRAEVRWFQSQEHRNGHTYWVVERNFDGALLGFCGVITVEEPESGMQGLLELGWRIRADMWRRDYAFEAASAVVEWARQNRSTERLYARIHQQNEASQALARKLGMRRDRKLEDTVRANAYDLHIFKLAARRE